MKFLLTSMLCLGTILLLCNKQVRAQEEGAVVHEKPPIVCFLPLDTYGKILSGDEKARLDNLAIHLLQDPEQVAYIHVYAGRLACAGEIQARLIRITNHLVKTRGVEAGRVISRDGGYREEALVELFLWPRAFESTPPSAAPTFDPSEVKIRDCKPLSRHRRGRTDSRQR